MHVTCIGPRALESAGSQNVPCATAAARFVETLLSNEPWNFMEFPYLLMLISVPEGGDVYRTLACVKCVAVAMSGAQPMPWTNFVMEWCGIVLEWGIPQPRATQQQGKLWPMGFWGSLVSDEP